MSVVTRLLSTVTVQAYNDGIHYPDDIAKRIRLVSDYLGMRVLIIC